MPGNPNELYSPYYADYVMPLVKVVHEQEETEGLQITTMILQRKSKCCRNGLKCWRT